MKRFGICSLICLALLGCAMKGPSLGAISAVQVLTNGVDRPKDQALCDGFALTEKEAADFINRALIVDHRIIHDHYDWAPCYVRGTGVFKAGNARWEIRAGGTGQIVFGGSEEEVLIADPKRWSEQD